MSKLQNLINQNVEEVDPIPLQSHKAVEVTAGELIEACKENPSHPYAKDFLKATKGLPENYKVTVHVENLEAIQADKTLKSNKVDGVITRVLGNPLNPTKDNTTKTTTKKSSS